MRGTSVNTTLIRSGPYKASTKPTVVLSWDVGNSFLSAPKLNKQAVDKQFMLIQLFFFFLVLLLLLLFLHNKPCSWVISWHFCAAVAWTEYFTAASVEGVTLLLCRKLHHSSNSEYITKDFFLFFPLYRSLSFLSLSFFFTICMKAAWGVETLSESCPKSRVHTLQGE